MWGAIIGDVVGSRFEFDNLRSKNFDFFTPKCFCTDDTVMSVAVAEALLKHETICDEVDADEFKRDLVSAFRKYGRAFPFCGFGNSFFMWVMGDDPAPYNSFGNGSAMRVSPVGWYAQTLDEAEHIAKLTSEVSHNHPEGIKGAVVTAGAIFLARTGKSKDEIKKYIESFEYNLSTSVATYQKTNKFDETCQKTIPVAMRCFLESEDFEDTIRNSISVGGDSDTIACIAGSLAEAFYGVPEELKIQVEPFVDSFLKPTLKEFDKKYLPKC